MQHPDEGLIHTWLDGELPAEEAAALEAHVAECEECKALVAEARGFIAASSRIVGALDNVPSGVIPVAKPVKRVWYSSPQFRAAAAVLVVAGASLLVMRTGTQKSTLSDSVRPEAGEAVTAQRSMAASAPPAVANAAPMRAPVVADQGAAKASADAPQVQVAAPAPQQLSKKIVAAPTSASVPTKANESDSSGRGVQGGTSNGVAGSLVLRDSAALRGSVAGVAMNAADAVVPRMPFATARADLKITRVDSSASEKKTTYRISSGKEVVLTEQQAAAERSEVAATGMAATAARESRKAGPSAPSPAPAPSPPASALMTQAQEKEGTVHTVVWFNAGRRFTLSGPVPVQQLEAIKAILLQEKQ